MIRAPDVHTVDGKGELTGLGDDKRAVVASAVVADGLYAGGAAGTVPGKYLGTKGAGPCMGGPSSDASVWNESAMDALDARVRAARLRRSLRLERTRRR